MAAPAKFLFDTDFAAPDKARERAATATEIAHKIAEAEARAYRAGYEAAQHEARVESDRRSALALEEIGITIRGIATRFSGIEPGWKPKRSKSRSRWRASCAAN
jgi:flagellar assembly protein FliH